MPEFAQYLNIRSATTPVLSSDGQWVYFLSDITGNFQVWRVSMQHNGKNPAQSWPQQLTYFPDKVWELYGSGAASHLIALSDLGGNEKQQLYLIEFDEGGPNCHEVRRLTTDDQAIHRFGAWSADGQKIVYTSNVRNRVDFDYYQFDLSTNQARLLRESEGNRTIEAWSPDQRYLLISKGVGPLEIELYLFDLQTEEETHLTAGHEPARYRQFTWIKNQLYCLSDRLHDQGVICLLDVLSTRAATLTPLPIPRTYQGKGELDLLAVCADEAYLAYTFNADGYSQVYKVALADTGNHHQPRLISTLPAGVIKKLSFDKTSPYLVLDLQAPDRNSDIWLVDLKTHEARQLTYSNRAGLAQSSFISPRPIQYSSFDQLEIPAFYYLPQSKPPEGGYPCILYVHGGPTSQVWPDFDVRFQYFLSQGYAILAPNVRGSAGYGRHYAALDDIDKRMDSVADLKSAVQWLHQQAEINADRITIYGRSYGGFMVLAALTEYPDLFAAGIDVVGISNWVTFLERTSAWRRSHREQEYGSLTDHRDLLERISPIHKADRIKAPLMVIAGDNDPRVPLSESEQIVERIQVSGGITKFVHYPDEGHKISKLHNRIDSFTQMANFLRTYL